jgi:hypothetical protein
MLLASVCKTLVAKTHTPPPLGQLWWCALAHPVLPILLPVTLRSLAVGANSGMGAIWVTAAAEISLRATAMWLAFSSPPNAPVAVVVEAVVELARLLAANV